MRDVVDERAVRKHSGREPSDPPPYQDLPIKASLPPLKPSDPPLVKMARRADQVPKLWSALKTIFSVLIGACAGVGSVYGWAKEKVDRSELNKVAEGDRAAASQLMTENNALKERVASLEGQLKVVLDQNQRILIMINNINYRDVRRGSPTRFPLPDNP